MNLKNQYIFYNLSYSYYEEKKNKNKRLFSCPWQFLCFPYYFIIFLFFQHCRDLNISKFSLKSSLQQQLPVKHFEAALVWKKQLKPLSFTILLFKSD